jgi:hypothetical protein
MNAPHRIRLHGPWEYEITGGERGRFRFADGWSRVVDKGFVGTVRLSRRFNRPTGLGDHNRVWLVVEAVPSGAKMSLNDDTLGTGGSDARAAEFDITRRLDDRNLLTIDFAVVDSPDPSLTDVHLEIRVD